MDVMDTSLKYLIWFGIGGAIFTLLYHLVLWLLLKRDRLLRETVHASITETVLSSYNNPSPSDAAAQSAPLLQSPHEIV